MDWCSKPDFWSLFYDWMFPAESFEQAKAQIDDIRDLSGVITGAVLDLCCGPGRHSVPFAKAGFHVTGVDLQKDLLMKAAEYAAQEGVAVEWVEEDMRSFRRTDGFDLIVNLFSSFGYFESPDEDQLVLENAYHCLRSGGRMVIDLRGKEIHARENSETYSHEMPNGDLVFHRTRTNDDWTQAHSTWVLVRDEKAQTFSLTYALYSGAELRALLNKAGFREVRLYGDLKGAPYNQRAERLVAVAEQG